LHPASGLGARQLAPQHRRQREADQIVERAAGPVGIDQIIVERPRTGHRLSDRGLGDRVERDPLDIGGQRAPLPEHLLHMPADRLAFPVRIGGQDQLVGFLRLVGDRLELLGLVGIGLPLHRKARVRIDRPVLGREIANMAVGSQDPVTRPEIFLDRLGLGRRLNNNKLHGGPFTRTCVGWWRRLPGVKRFG
jgi:hypothetical protein